MTISVGTRIKQAAWNRHFPPLLDDRQRMSRTTSPIDAAAIWLNATYPSCFGSVLFSASYVEKKTAAGNHSQLRSSQLIDMLTSWSATKNNTSDTFVYPPESTCFDESLSRLQTRFHRIEWEEEEVDRCSCNAPGLCGYERLSFQRRSRVLTINDCVNDGDPSVGMA